MKTLTIIVLKHVHTVLVPTENLQKCRLHVNYKVLTDNITIQKDPTTLDINKTQ